MTAPVGSPPSAPIPGSTVARRMPRWPLIVLVAVLVLLGLLAIVIFRGGDEDTDAASALQRERQSVVDAELAFFRTICEANDPPNPTHPGLAAHATDQAYATAVRAAREAQSKGLACRRPPNSRSRHQPEVVSLDGNRAVVRDCAVDDGLVVEIATGKVVDAEVETVLYEVTLTRTGEGAPWKVSLSKAQQRWDGVAGCAA